MKSSIFFTVLFMCAFLGMGTTAMGQNEAPLVKIYLKNNSLLPKGVGLKITKPDLEPSTSFYGSWMPLAKKELNLPIGTKVEYISNKALVMSGNAKKHQGKLIAEVKAGDRDKVFSF
jgi:hypothetical protein